MAENKIQAEQTNGSAEAELEGGSYEIIRQRLTGLGAELHSRIDKLNETRKKVFGALETVPLGSDRIQTQHNCAPRDIISIGNMLIFGYNVFIGLKKETIVSDVFSVYAYNGKQFEAIDGDFFKNPQFEKDFRELYLYYRETRFATFRKIGAALLMVFQTGKKCEDIKVFKWEITGENNLVYQHNRAEREYVFPPQHGFEWKKTTRDNHVRGLHPHVSVEDRVFVETIGGDLTIKVENNTASGEGIYTEPVDKADQTLNDAEISYAIMGSLIILKILPYQEENYRYIVFDEKRKEAIRIDDLARCAVILPEDDGLIFPGGCFLIDQGYKSFKINTADMKYLRLHSSPNGEDFLYIFYNEASGEYILLQYNLISKQIEKPLTCNGYTLFDDGRLIFFREGQEPVRSHSMQIWQTPFVIDESHIKTGSDSYLCRIGNRDLVRGISDLRSIYNLLKTEKIYQGLYYDIVKRITATLDIYFWLNREEAFNPRQILVEIRNTANSAIDEFEKMVRIKKDTAGRMEQTEEEVKKLIRAVSGTRYEDVEKYVESITKIKNALGGVISLRDVRYADRTRLEAMEAELRKTGDKVSRECTEFLLKEDAFHTYIRQLEKIDAKVPVFKKSADMTDTEAELAAQNAGLDLLMELINTLKIEDPVKTTHIIESISEVYSRLNQVKARFKNRQKELMSGEMSLEFNAQFKLISQTVMNFLEQAITPAKCNELLTRILVQIEELEGKFSGFEEFINQLSEKREEVYSVFNNKKVQLEEIQNNKINSLVSSADRIFKSLSGRMGSFKTIEEMNSYFAGDRMVEKIRDIIKELFEAGASVKAEDAAGKLKSLQQDSIRQLKDRIDLYAGGRDLITLGNFRFTVNTQEFGLTTVFRESALYFHLTGTDFFEEITDESLNTTKAYWQRLLVSETPDIYRAAYLAYQLLQAGKDPADWPPELLGDEEQLIAKIREFASVLYDEGYDKGVHDRDCAKILMELYPALKKAGSLKYHPLTRAGGAFYWYQAPETETKKQLCHKLISLALISKELAGKVNTGKYEAELDHHIKEFYKTISWQPGEQYLAGAAQFIIEEIVNHGSREAFTIHETAWDLYEDFNRFLEMKHLTGDFGKLLESAGADIGARINIAIDWLEAFSSPKADKLRQYIPETASLLLLSAVPKKQVKRLKTDITVKGLLGDHRSIVAGKMTINLCNYLLSMRHFHTIEVPGYRRYVKIKQNLTEQRSKAMRLEEFKPGILTSFVRNKLIDKVYLPLIGTNLAKQMGAYGEAKRTDLMGLLLLISPPGYGKTTLMEYIANRLGLIFMKINAPAIGNRVTSLDPTEAPNITAKKEIEKLNLALEMSNNVMLYIDDIQHSNPEFLQKFISLCDAQRKIEGVFKGITRTYDLRGKKFCVVMAGNPYTESGEKFRIPDMLANRADTYNLGDILGGYAEYFNLSYLENALTSHPVLNKLANRSQHDVYEIIEIAKTGNSGGVNFEARYAIEEIKEFVTIFEKLLTIQAVILKVNQLYIYSAGQDEDYRKEPPFLLQGSYRNMNRLAEKVAPIMNEKELQQLITDHYTDESQLLTSGAEFNLLRFKEEVEWLTPGEEERLAYIRKTFMKNRAIGKVKEGDSTGQLMGQLNLFNDQFSGFVELIKNRGNL